jgi:hypothetical protein
MFQFLQTQVHTKAPVKSFTLCPRSQQIRVSKCFKMAHNLLGTSSQAQARQDGKIIAFWCGSNSAGVPAFLVYEQPFSMAENADGNLIKPPLSNPLASECLP